jgi:pimeloyl-ACP methyl ester carboxylesterase
MLGGAEDFNWVFFCDPFGVRSNGTYYLGCGGDRSTETLIDEMWGIIGSNLDSELPVITMGSSMGGHAAIEFAAKWSAKGAVAVSPHLDLRRAASEGGRWDEIAWAVPGGDPASVDAEVDTQRLFVPGKPGSETTQVVIQYALDDPGCVVDDVIRLQQFFEKPIMVDVRSEGGHTSDFAPRDWWLRTVDAIIAGSALSQRDFARLSVEPKIAIVVRLTLWLRRAPFRIYTAFRHRRNHAGGK